MTISSRRKQALYDCVYNDIMDARLKIHRILEKHPPLRTEVDNILSDLTVKAPESAVREVEAKTKKAL